MAALAFGALLLVACTPLIMLGRSVDLDYHRMILAVVAMFAVAGGAALRMIWRGIELEAAPGWRTAVVGFCVRSVALGHGGTVGVNCTGGATAFWFELRGETAR